MLDHQGRKDHTFDENARVYAELARLAFARGEGTEQPADTDMSALLDRIVRGYRREDDRETRDHEAFPTHGITVSPAAHGVGRPAEYVVSSLRRGRGAGKRAQGWGPPFLRTMSMASSSACS